MSNRLDISKAGLSTAMDAGEFVLYYQPDFDSKTEEVSGLEAFIRWDHSTQGLCDAGSFIAGFERDNDMTCRLDQWVLNTALTQGKEFLNDANVIKTISVNLSNWLSGEALVASVRDALNATGFPAKFLSLECPWRMFAAHNKEIIPVMRKLKALGCSLVMDGGSLESECLAVLKVAPVTTSKICYKTLHDKVDEVGVDEASLLIKSLRQMKVKVVVVGVEDEEHAQLVRRTSCSLSQGHRFKSPLSAINVLQLLSIIKKTKEAFTLL